MRRLGFIAIIVLALLAGAASAQAATFDVTSVDDTGAGTLRQAITNANADSTADEIHFDVGALGGFISPESPLPAITQPVTIDGTTDPEYFDSPVVFLDGSLAGALANGLVISGGPTTVKGLDIEFFELAGIRIASSGNTLTANSIGVFGGGNLGPGVAIASGAANNTVGGTTAGAGNSIQGNEAGVVLEAGSGNGNRIAGNAIGGNDEGSNGLGIDLNDDGITANDIPDAVTGRNTNLNFPVLTNVTTDDTSTTIAGTLDARAGTQYRIEFFGVAACDQSGNGEGDVFLGSSNVTTDGGGHAVINAVLGDPLSERFVTATATDPAGNTSELSACQAGPPSGVVVSNGTVQLGVNKTGSLNYSCVAGEPGCPAPTPEGTEPVGLRYVPLNIDSTAPGCPCEGWGVADAASGLTGFANEASGDGNLTPVSITRSPDGKTATVVVDVEDPSITGRSLRVTHLYRPSALNSALYEDVVSVHNTGTQPLADLLFRRVMDWDIEPTAFDEWVTNHGTSPQLRFDSDQGFASSDPLTGPAYLESESKCGVGYTGHCEFADLGAGGEYPAVTAPSDHGGLFDFGFGALPAGATKTITTYYGAAPSETAAIAALNAGGAQVYSLGQSDCPNGSDTGGCSSMATGAGPTQGTPATFMFGFVTTSGDLSITQSDSPDPALPGQEVTYTLTIHNNGPDAAAAVQVEDTLPSGVGVTIGTISTSKGSCAAPSGGKVVCSIGSMPSGSTETITIHATRSSVGTMTNSAVASGASEDANPGNNDTTETTTVELGTTLSVNDTNVNPEGNSGTTNATFTITRAGDTSGTSSVHYSTSDGSATQPADYTAVPDTTVTFTSGQTTKTVDVAVKGDTLDEDNETYTLGLSNATGATISDATGTGTITDDDDPPSLSIDDVTVTEGNAGTVNATFTVSLSQASGKTVGVTAASANGSATQPADYTASGNVPLSFSPGQTTKTVTVVVKGDTIDEDDETFTVGLSGASNATIADNSGTGTITDDDAAPSLSIGDVSVTEGNLGTVNATFTVTLSQASGKTVGVSAASADGSATQPGDYTATGSVPLSFSPGQTSKTVTVVVKGDTIDEVDETFVVGLSGASNATIADAEATGTIVDDDGPSISISDATVNPEGTGGSASATFTVSLSGASVQAISVKADTAAGSATAPADFTATSVTLNWAAGDGAAKTVTVPIVTDSLDESDETFTVALSEAVHASIADGSGNGTIVDDDTTAAPVVPAVSVGNATVDPEGDSGSKPATFAVTLSQATTVPVTVSYATADGTAKQPGDYAAASGSLTFAPGETSKSVAVAVNGDLIEEPSETFALVLSSPSGATLGTASGTGTIVDDDKDAPENEPPGSVDPNGLFCGRQHRGKCRGIKFKGVFDRPGNAVWTFAAYNASPGSSAAAAATRIKLGSKARSIPRAGTFSVRFKVRGAKADRLRKKIKRAGFRDLRVSLAFTTPEGKRYVVQGRSRLKR
jgi:uncharacterized repeat protein (TIGR01451 family)